MPYDKSLNSYSDAELERLLELMRELASDTHNPRSASYAKRLVIAIDDELQRRSQHKPAV